MTTATLDAPLPLNPAQATKLQLRTVHLEIDAGAIRIEYDMLDSTGALVDRRTATVQTPASATYVQNQATALGAKLLAALGVTGDGGVKG